MKPATNAFVGVIEELAGGRDLLQDAVLEDSDTIAERHRLDLVVRDVDGRDAQTVA